MNPTVVEEGRAGVLRLSMRVDPSAAAEVCCCILSSAGSGDRRAAAAAAAFLAGVLVIARTKGDGSEGG
jgi:hypothetical protein